MPQPNRNASEELMQAREALKVAQARVTELEALVAESPPSHIAIADVKERYGRILDNLLESCQIIGFDWRYLYLNDMAAKWGRQPKENLLGHTVTEMYTGIETTDMFALMRKSMDERISQDAEFEFVYPDQSRAWFEFRIQPVPEGIFILTLNISDRKQGDTQIRKLHRTLSVLSDINQSIVRTRDIPTLFEKACNIAVQKGAFRMALLSLVDSQTNGMRLIARAGLADDDLEKLNNALKKTSQDVSLSELVVRSGERVVINDVENDPTEWPWRTGMLQLGCRAIAALPLTVNTEVRGVFFLYSQETNFFDEEELKLVDEMAMDISFAMTFAEQEDRRQQAQEEVRRFAQRMEILHAIDVKIIESSSIQSLLEVVVKHLRKLIPCSRVSAALINPDTAESVIYALDVNLPSSISEGVHTYLTPAWFEEFGTDNTRIIDDLRLVPHPLPAYAQLVKEGLLSSLQVLLTYRDRPVGVFGLSANTVGFFTAAHQEIAAEVGRQLSIAIRQLQLGEELAQRAADLERNNVDLKRAEAGLQRYAQRMEVLHEIDKRLIQGGSIEELIQITLSHLRRLIPCQQANLILIDHKTNEGIIYLVDYSRDANFDKGVRYPLVADVFEGFDDRNIKVFDDIRLLTENNVRTKRLVSEGLVSGLSVLLINQNTPIAALSLLADQPNFFNSDYQQIALEVANQLAVALGQLKLSEELEQRVLDRTAELNEAKSRVEAILNSNTDGVVLVYKNAGIQQTNQTFNTLFQCKEDDYFGEPLTTLVSVEDQERLTQAINAAISEKQGRTIEVRARLRNDTFFDAEMGISTMLVLGRNEMGFVCSIHDITERMQLTKELDEQRRFLREVIDVSPSMIFVKDYNARFVLANPRVAALYNTTPEELIGKSDVDFNFSEQEANHFLEADRRVIATGEHLFIEEPVTNARGETHWLQTTKVPIVSGDGNSKYVLGVATDITGRIKSEQMLQETLKREKELSELKSRFVAMASHEFRTPLATILAITETLMAYRHKMEDSQIEQRLYKIQDQVHYLKDIIDDVLQLAQIQAKRIVFNPVRVDLDAMCRSVLDEFQSRPDIKHELVYSYDVGTQVAKLDKRLMRQIISNLMSNAVKYSPAGKTIRISLKEQDNILVMTIQDQGIGIPEADLEHLFEPFHRAANVGTISGTGLGLVISKESVELHGGTINVESQVGVGTTFTVKIPLLPSD